MGGCGSGGCGVGGGRREFLIIINEDLRNQDLKQFLKLISLFQLEAENEKPCFLGYHA